MAQGKKKKVVKTPKDMFPKRKAPRVVKETYETECTSKQIKVSLLENGNVGNRKKFEVYVNLLPNGQVGLSRNQDKKFNEYGFLSEGTPKTFDRWEKVLKTLLMAVQVARRETE